MIQSQWVQAMLLLDQGQRLQGAAGSPAAAATVAAAIVQGLGPAVEPMPELAVEPELGPVVEPVGPSQPAETVPGHLVDHSLVVPGLPLQLGSLLLQAAWLLLQLQVLSLVASWH